MNQDWMTAFEALRSVYAEDAYSNIAINEAISRHRGCRDSFVRSMVKGTLRDTIRLDCIIDQLADKGAKSIRIRPLTILRMALYAIRSMDSVPDHAAVSEAVSLARKAAKGTDKFVNAVLRSYLRRRDEVEREPEELWLRYSFPRELTELIERQYPGEAEAVLKGLNTPPPLVLRVNTLRVTADEAADMLRREGIETSRTELSDRVLIAEGGPVLSSDLYRRGLITVQSLSSVLAIEKLAPRPGSRVLDMCAAPGGKTMMMAEMMENTGSITACDIHEHRLGLIDANAARLGVTIAKTRLLDGTEHDSSLDDSYDFVLADVPCSGIGVIGTKPEIRLRTDPAEYEGLEKIQLAILRNAVRYAKPGGLIEYSTCTLNRDENERVIEALQAEGSLVSVVEMNTFLPYNILVGFYYCLLRKNS